MLDIIHPVGILYPAAATISLLNSRLAHNFCIMPLFFSVWIPASSIVSPTLINLSGKDTIENDSPSLKAEHKTNQLLESNLPTIPARALMFFPLISSASRSALASIFSLPCPLSNLVLGVSVGELHNTAILFKEFSSSLRPASLTNRLNLLMNWRACTWHLLIANGFLCAICWFSCRFSFKIF